MYITDGKRRLVDLNGADTSFSLILRRLELMTRTLQGASKVFA